MTCLDASDSRRLLVELKKKSWPVDSSRFSLMDMSRFFFYLKEAS